VKRYVKKIGLIIFALAIAVLISVGYIFQLGTVFASAFRLPYSIGFSLFYLSCWILYLFYSAKKNAKKMLKIYKIFWTIGTIFSLVRGLLLIIQGAQMFLGEIFLLEMLFIFDMYVFLVPLAGFDIVVHYVFGDYYFFMLSTIMSATMLVIGFLVKKKLTK